MDPDSDIDSSENIAELFGQIKKVIFSDKGKNSIFIVHTISLNKDFRCVCPFYALLEEGDTIYAVCQFEMDPQVGQQLRVIKPPFIQIAMDQDSIIRFFIRALRGTGFGNKKANQLYQELLKRAEESSTEHSSNPVVSYLSELAYLWNNTPDENLLAPYTSIVTIDQMRRLLNWWYHKRSIRRLLLFGLTKAEVKACHLSHDTIYEKCLTNPYTLPPIPLEKCDEILWRQNKIGSQENRRCGQIVRKIYEFQEERGWTSTPISLLRQLFSDLPQHLDRLQKEFSVLEDFESLYLNYTWNVETHVAERVNNLLRSDSIEGIKSFSEDAHFVSKTLTQEQKDAIQGALNCNICIITGPPGSGKTTIISEIIHNLELREIPYCIASFTGKAVSRIRQVIRKRCPSTLHRLIARSSQTPKFRHLIIDEASMVTSELFYQFLKTFPYNYKITLIGDVNQLPPIGWGSLFSQLISCGRIPIYFLRHNHRLYLGDMDTRTQNGILINALRIIEADPNSPFQFVETDNFRLLEGSVEYVYDIIRLLYQNNIPSEKLTVICPYNSNLDELNKTYQEIFNEGYRSIVDSRGTLWMIKDRVMLIENNYAINIYNGEEGIVTDIKDDSIDVVFGDGAQHNFLLEPTKKKKKKKKNFDPLDDDEDYDDELTVMKLKHSFAVTCHKCQGSEWDYVILYIPSSPANNHFLSQNLIYTSITRAKRALWIVGDIDALTKGVTRPSPHRYDNLSLRLSQTTLNLEPTENIVIPKFEHLTLSN